MRLLDAEREIKQIWQQWPNKKEKYGTSFGLTLYAWLENNRLDLLSFNVKGDKYQRVNGWVIQLQNEYRKIDGIS